MNKYRLKRMHRYNSDFEENELDDRYVEGTINHFPDVGESLQFVFNRPDKGSWMTSEIIAITQPKKNGLIILDTKNSIYHLRAGWGK